MWRACPGNHRSLAVHGRLPAQNSSSIQRTGHPHSIPYFNPILAPYDLTRGGSPYTFNGHTDVKELALYLRDVITKGNWSLNLGMRGDLYNGLVDRAASRASVGIAYNVKKTNTILRVSYARTLESPFNENLILSSIGCENAVLNPLLLCGTATRGLESRLSQ